MLYSMTGYGEARRQNGQRGVVVEVRSINSRHFKLSIRASDGYAALEPRIEAVVRKYVRRGTVQVQARVDRPRDVSDYRINGELLNAYRSELAGLTSDWACKGEVSVDALLPLPGVVEELDTARQSAENDWPLLEPCLNEAMQQLVSMRAEEGETLKTDLSTNCQIIATRLKDVESKAPLVVVGYRDRIADRVNKLLVEMNVTIEPSDIVREVSLFADRCDISEEVVRLRSHLEQFAETLQNEDAAGKKLEFIVQEMGRETNTIGSKANDSDIASYVVEIKTALERIREQVQNVE